jgi:hypothetical protein
VEASPAETVGNDLLVVGVLPVHVDAQIVFTGPLADPIVNVNRHHWRDFTLMYTSDTAVQPTPRTATSLTV